MILKTKRYLLCFLGAIWLGPGIAIFHFGLVLSKLSLIHQSTPEYWKNTVVLGVNTMFNFLKSQFKERGLSNPTSSNLKVKYLRKKCQDKSQTFLKAKVWSEIIWTCPTQFGAIEGLRQGPLISIDTERSLIKATVCCVES